MRLSVIIPSFNGGEILAEHLPGVFSQLREIGGGVELIVVDDASTLSDDRTGQVVGELGRPARLLRLEGNLGFAGACNHGAREAEGKTLLFLNSDMRPEPGAVAVMLEEYERRHGAFALTPVIINLAHDFPESITRMIFRWGVFEVDFPCRRGVPAPPPGEWQPIAYPCGGAVVVSREAFLGIGGFPGLYAPFYWEDVDLGHRARRYGLESYVTGSARMLHDHSRTIGALYSPDEVLRIFERNRLLFTWTHLKGLGPWLRHLVWLLPRTLVGLVLGNFVGGALAAALRRLPGVQAARRELRVGMRFDR